MPLQDRRFAEREFAIALEKVGKTDDAIKHAKLAGFDELLAILYLKERRFSDAQAIADNNVLDNRIIEYDYHHGDVGSWLQFRAVVECQLGQYEDAVRDLKEAALKNYQFGDTDASSTCMGAANVLIEKFHLGQPFKLEVLLLPTKGKARVVELVKFLSTSATPLSIAELNRITGAHIKLPGETWPNVYQEEKEIRPFDHLEYRTEDDRPKDPELFMVNIAIDECCVPKSEIDSLLPVNGTKIPPVSIWNGSDQSPDAEAWKLPAGRLLLKFRIGGARVLDYLEFNALKPYEKVIATQRLGRAAGSVDDNESHNELVGSTKDKAAALFGKAQAEAGLGNMESARADAKAAADDYFSKAQIVLRDRVLEWLKSLPETIDDSVRQVKFLRSVAPTLRSWNTFDEWAKSLKGAGVANVSSANASIKNAKFESFGSSVHKLTFAELFEMMARQTKSTLHYDSNLREWVFDKPQMPLPYSIEVANGWKVEDRGYYVSYIPPLAPVGMDIYMNARFVGLSDQQLKEIRDEQAVVWADKIRNGVTADDMTKTAVDGVEAIYFRAKAPIEGRQWRQWAFVKNGQLFIVVSAVDDKNETALIPDVEKMLQSFHVIEPAVSFPGF